LLHAHGLPTELDIPRAVVVKRPHAMETRHAVRADGEKEPLHD
jgi:hypothetical protein